ncbi:HXXEE domain-containing protein [Paenibacillus gyeongsangnamensis]|uniref:HXXEE domain-containing protein n=1 Tax=Paenibacillus gyeongsangnamensis TaxID=3388067 RepID=UPI0039082EB6
MASQYITSGPPGNIHFFVVCTLIFFVHLFTHIGQAIFFRRLTPGALTSALLVLPYCLILYQQLFQNHIVTWGMIVISLPFAVLIVPVLLTAHWIGRNVV